MDLFRSIKIGFASFYVIWVLVLVGSISFQPHLLPFLETVNTCNITILVLKDFSFIFAFAIVG